MLSRKRLGGMCCLVYYFVVMVLCWEYSVC